MSSPQDRIADGSNDLTRKENELKERALRNKVVRTRKEHTGETSRDSSNEVA
jgi:hypothetical protein